MVAQTTVRFDDFVVQFHLLHGHTPPLEALRAGKIGRRPTDAGSHLNQLPSTTFIGELLDPGSASQLTATEFRW